MANYKGGANTICPFYERETDRSITCEGLRENSVLTMRFPARKDKSAWQEDFCMTFAYRRCPLARACYEKYEEPERYAVRAVASGM